MLEEPFSFDIIELSAGAKMTSLKGFKFEYLLIYFLMVPILELYSKKLRG